MSSELFVANTQTQTQIYRHTGRQLGMQTETHVSTDRKTDTQTGCFHLTYLCLVGLSVLWQLDELLGEQRAAVAQYVPLELRVRAWMHKLHHYGVSRCADMHPHALSLHCRG